MELPGRTNINGLSCVFLGRIDLRHVRDKIIRPSRATDATTSLAVILDTLFYLCVSGWGSFIHIVHIGVSCSASCNTNCLHWFAIKSGELWHSLTPSVVLAACRALNTTDQSACRMRHEGIIDGYFGVYLFIHSVGWMASSDRIMSPSQVFSSFFFTSMQSLPYRIQWIEGVRRWTMIGGTYIRKWIRTCWNMSRGAAKDSLPNCHQRFICTGLYRLLPASHLEKQNTVKNS